MNTAGLFQRLRSLVPLPPVLVGTVLAHHEDDTSTVLIPGSGQVSYGGGIAVGSLIRPRGRTVPVGKKAFVRAGVIETQAPDVEPFPIVIGEVLLPPVVPPPPLFVELNAANVGLTSANGVVVSGLDPLLVYSLSLPAGRAHVAWSAYPSDESAPGGSAWRNNFYVTTGNLPVVGTGDPRTQMFGAEMFFGSAEAARASFGGGSITGHDTYTFWMYDPFPSDDRGGLSVQLLSSGT